jgi:hypothetical protein
MRGRYIVKLQEIKQLGNCFENDAIAVEVYVSSKGVRIIDAILSA